MRDKKIIIYTILGELFLLVRAPLMSSDFISRLDYEFLLLLCFLYSCVFVIVYFLFLEYYEIKNNKEKGMFKYSVKYLIVFIIPTVLDQIIITVVNDNAVNQLVWLLGDVVFFGIDYIIILLFIWLFRKTDVR